MDFTANWHWPQWTWVTFVVIQLFASAILHDKDRTGEYNAFVNSVSIGVSVFILICGGFFK